MPALILVELPGVRTNQYDRVNEIMGIGGGDAAPRGLIQHVAGADGDTVVIADVWESAEAFEEFFGGRAQAAMAAAGVDVEATPRVLPVHNMFEGRGTDAGVMMIVEVEDLGPDKYDEMTAKMSGHYDPGTTHPAVSHVAAATVAGGVLVVDVWESPAAFAEFAETELAPAGADVGMGPLDPRFVPVHNRLRGRAPMAAGQAG